MVLCLWDPHTAPIVFRKSDHDAKPTEYAGSLPTVLAPDYAFWEMAQILHCCTYLHNAEQTAEASSHFQEAFRGSGAGTPFQCRYRSYLQVA